MPRRIAEIELGLCFLIMFGSAAIADDEPIFDLSEARIQQVAAQPGDAGGAQVQPYSAVPETAEPQRSLQPPPSHVVPDSAYPTHGTPHDGYHEEGHPHYGHPGYGSPQYGPSNYGYPEYGPSGYGHLQDSHLQYGHPPYAYAYPQHHDPEFAYPSEYPPSADVPLEEGRGFFGWRPNAPHFDLPSRSYSLFRSPASYGWGYHERCAPTPWKPRGDGIPQRTSCYRMDYAPYQLKHDSSRHGPAFYLRHELYPCEECHKHAVHLQRYYGRRY